MSAVIQFLEQNTYGYKVVESAVLILLLFLSSMLFKNILHKRTDFEKYHTYKRSINYIIGTIGLLAIIYIWIDSSVNITTYIGLLSAGIAIALKEIFINIAGWIFLEFRRPFDIGHRIKIGDQKGDVIDKRLFQFTMMEVSSVEEGEQSTGRIVDIPNSFVFIYPTINYSKGFEYIWNEVKVLLTFESDWQLAKKLLLDFATKDSLIVTEDASKQIKRASKKYMINYNNLTPIVYTDIKASGIELSIRYLCEPKTRRLTVNNIWEDILKMVKDHPEIALAYPTKRIINS